jgi:hypothetical protein
MGCCRCGCGQLIAPGRRFVNQAHYDRTRSLSPAEAKQLVVAFHRGATKRQLAQEYGIGFCAVKRILRRYR